MSIIGWLLLIGVSYECGFAATHIFLKTLPVCEKNLFASRYPTLMCALFPFPLIFCNLIPTGYFPYYFACLMMQMGSLITWGLWAVAFIFLPVSWWYFGALCGITFICALFVPKEMENVMKSGGYHCYLPEDKYKKR